MKCYTKNWLGDRHAAFNLADSIADYWRSHGYPGVKVWVEERLRMGADRLPRTDYDIRSNIGPTGFPPRETSAFAV